jgi:hypothetical protein
MYDFIYNKVSRQAYEESLTGGGIYRRQTNLAKEIKESFEANVKAAAANQS